MGGSAGSAPLLLCRRGARAVLDPPPLECPDRKPLARTGQGLKGPLPMLPPFAEHCAVQNVGARTEMQGCWGTTAGIYPGSKTGAASCPFNRSSEEKAPWPIRLSKSPAMPRAT